MSAHTGSGTPFTFVIFMQPVFFNWTQPFLPAVAEYLVQRHQDTDDLLDFGNVFIAVPGARAKRRLEELLFLETEKIGPNWVPPTILTLGSFPELLYPQQKPSANDLVQQMAWVSALRDFSKHAPELLTPLIPDMPSSEDWSSLLAFGRIFAQLHLELAADRLTFDDIREYCDTHSLPDEAVRWKTLAELQGRYLAILDALSLWDVQTARLYALDKNECQTDHEIILVGLVDLNRTQRSIFETVSERVTPLVFAPRELAHLFDRFGCVDVEAWQEQKIEIPEEWIEPADTPSGQASAVLSWLRKLDGKYSADEILLGVPDEEVTSLLSQQLAQVGLVPRHVAGTPMAQSPVFLLLEALANYIENRRFYDFTTLLRHPDLERFLQDHYRTNITSLSDDPDDEVAEKTVPDFSEWLTELDTYHENHLPLQVDGSWLLRPKKESEENLPPKSPEPPEDVGEVPQSENTRKYRLLHWFGETMDTLLTDFLTGESSRLTGESSQQKFARKLVDWITPIQELLREIYPPRSLNPENSIDHILQKSFEELQKIFDKLQSVPDSLAPKMTVSQVLTLILRLFRNERIPPKISGNHRDRELELLGWLDLTLDDALVVAVTGLNEGIVPSSKTADSFLPDTMRRRLNLEDNRKRYARDAYVLSTLLHSRQEIRLIFGKRSIAGDPLIPSRLFFATDEETIAKRVFRFFDKDSRESTPLSVGFLHPGLKISGFKLPQTSDFKPPRPPDEPVFLRQIRVTEFRDYLQCPYRYYLKHQLRLELKEDLEEELDGAAFGDLIHAVVKRFGQSPVRNSTDAARIREFLDDQLEQTVHERYGQSYRPVIAIQLEQMRLRLAAFAEKQAVWAQTHEILHVEYSPENQGGHIIDIDHVPVKLQGRIDRIDLDHQSGKHVLLDYKTAGEGDSPEKTHKKGNQWIDLQLPLYRTLYQDTGSEEMDVELGFVVLPKDTKKTDFKIANWNLNDYYEAEKITKSVVRKIRQGVFWPPTFPPPRFSEVYAAICMDKQHRYNAEKDISDDSADRYNAD